MTALQVWVDKMMDFGDARQEADATRKAAEEAKGSPLEGLMRDAAVEADKRLFNAKNEWKLAFDAIIRGGK